MTHLFTLSMLSMFVSLVFSLCLATPAQAQAKAESPYWRDQRGQPVAETESMKSMNDFAGAVIVTTDEDWQAKWNTPPETKPNFNRAGTVPYGKRIYLLAFFSNAAADATGRINVRCDITLTDPLGKITLTQRNLSCHTGQLGGSRYLLRLSEVVIGFSGDPGDPPGMWTFDVTLRDEVRGVALPLRVRFELREKGQ